MCVVGHRWARQAAEKIIEKDQKQYDDQWKEIISKPGVLSTLDELKKACSATKSRLQELSTGSANCTDRREAVVAQLTKHFDGARPIQLSNDLVVL